MARSGSSAGLSQGWLAAARLEDIRFIEFGDLQLPPEASDRTVWTACQATGIVLVTGNRIGGPDSLDRVIHELNQAHHLPVLTFSDPPRVIAERSYAEACTIKLLQLLEQLDSLRGVGRLFIP